MIWPQEVLSTLDARHVRCLNRHQQMVLAAQWLGMSIPQMVKAFGCSKSTIVRVRRTTIQDVFDGTGLEGTPQLLRLWSERHWTCCTTAALEVTQNSQKLTLW